MGSQEKGKGSKPTGAPAPTPIAGGQESANSRVPSSFGRRGSQQKEISSKPISPSFVAQDQGLPSDVRGGAMVGNGRRTSLMPQPQPGVPLVNFDSDDYSSDDEPQRGPPPPIGGSQRQVVPGFSPVSVPATGTEGARPMVGGFAAAAYEAAKAHHFANKNKQKQQNPAPR